jgi:hypothetical protein
MNKASWIDRFYDARFSAEETTEWERLVAKSTGDKDKARDEATQELIRRRETE